jgi:hypothetical protein
MEGYGGALAVKRYGIRLFKRQHRPQIARGAVWDAAWGCLPNQGERSRQNAREDDVTQDEAHQSRPVLIKGIAQHNRSFSALRVCRLRRPAGGLTDLA